MISIMKEKIKCRKKEGKFEREQSDVFDSSGSKNNSPGKHRGDLYKGDSVQDQTKKSPIIGGDGDA